MSHEQALRLVQSVTRASGMATAAEGFYLDRQANHCTAATLVFYRKYVGALLAWLGEHGITDPAAVTAAHIRAWLVELQGRKLADWTVHHHAAAARAFFNFCVDEELLTVSPMRKVKMPRLSKEIQPAFTPDDVRAILGACATPRDTAMVLCLLDTGCRAAEFVALNVGDVDTPTGTVTVRQGKGRKDRVTFLGSKARKALWRYLRGRSTTPAAALWPSEKTGERLTTWGLAILLKRLGTRANVPHCHPHTFRRTFALWSLRAGMDIFSLQKLMGHADLSVLRKYLDQVNEDLEEAHRAHGAVDSML